MNFSNIVSTIAKGIDIAQKAVAVGKNVKPILDAVGALAESAKAGTVTPEVLAATDASLDAMIDEFNEPIPD